MGPARPRRRRRRGGHIAGRKKPRRSGVFGAVRGNGKAARGRLLGPGSSPGQRKRLARRSAPL